MSERALLCLLCFGLAGLTVVQCEVDGAGEADRLAEARLMAEGLDRPLVISPTQALAGALLLVGVYGGTQPAAAR